MSAASDQESELPLEPGESLLWSGRPHYPHFRSEAWASFVFGIIASVAAAGAWLMSCAAVRDVVCNANFGLIPALPIALLPAGVFSAVAFQCLSAPWVARRKLARTWYAVTNRRVIVYRSYGYASSGMLPEPSRELYSFTPEQARACVVKRRHGRRVDLVFGQEHPRRSVVEIGILGAEDWQGAERALGTAFRG